MGTDAETIDGSPDYSRYDECGFFASIGAVLVDLSIGEISIPRCFVRSSLSSSRCHAKKLMIRRYIAYLSLYSTVIADGDCAGCGLQESLTTPTSCTKSREHER